MCRLQTFKKINKKIKNKKMKEEEADHLNNLPYV